MKYPFIRWNFELDNGKKEKKSFFGLYGVFKEGKDGKIMGWRDYYGWKDGKVDIYPLKKAQYWLKVLTSDQKEKKFNFKVISLYNPGFDKIYPEDRLNRIFIIKLSKNKYKDLLTRNFKKGNVKGHISFNQEDILGR